jgi:hypothetical protein
MSTRSVARESTFGVQLEEFVFAIPQQLTAIFLLAMPVFIAELVTQQSIPSQLVFWFTVVLSVLINGVILTIYIAPGDREAKSIKEAFLIVSGTTVALTILLQGLIPVLGDAAFVVSFILWFIKITGVAVGTILLCEVARLR